MIPCTAVDSLLATREGADDVGVAWVSDGQAADTVVAAAGSAKLVVVTVKVVHACLRQHRVVLDLALPERRAVVGDEDQLGLALAERLQGCLVAQAVLSAL